LYSDKRIDREKHVYKQPVETEPDVPNLRDSEWNIDENFSVVVEIVRYRNIFGHRVDFFPSFQRILRQVKFYQVRLN